MGDGSTTDRATPVQVTGLTGVVAIAAGDAHSLAVKSNGPVWAWGSNQSGQLGDGTTIDRLTPVQVSGLSGAVAVTGGGTLFMYPDALALGTRSQSLALKADGTLWAGGANDFGQLGDGAPMMQTRPVEVSGLSGALPNAEGIAAGYAQSLLVKGDATVWTWGSSGTSLMPDSVPVQVAGLAGVAAVAQNDSYSVVLKQDGTVWEWPLWGEVARPAPVQWTGLDDIVAVAAGWSGWDPGPRLALKRDRTVWQGYYGAPVQVSGLTGVVAIAGTWDGGQALKGQRDRLGMASWRTGPSKRAQRHRSYRQKQWRRPGAKARRDSQGVECLLLGRSARPRDAGPGERAHGSCGGCRRLRLQSRVDTRWHGLGLGKEPVRPVGRWHHHRPRNPVPVSGLTGVAAIAGGSAHSLAVKGDGTVWAWGADESGQLGDGRAVIRTRPAQVHPPLSSTQPRRGIQRPKWQAPGGKKRQ